MQSAYEAFQEGSRLLASQDVHAAVIALERARDLEPQQGSVREALARAYYRTARFPAAGVEFAAAVELDPVNDYAHFGLGLALLKQSDVVGARRHLKLAVAMRPGQADYRAALERALAATDTSDTTGVAGSDTTELARSDATEFETGEFEAGEFEASDADGRG